MALKAVAGGSGGGGLVGSAGAFNIQLSNTAGGVVDGNYFLSLLAPFDMTLTGAAVWLDSGSFDMEIQIDSVLVAGSQETVSGGTTYAFTADNVLYTGSECVLLVTNSTGNPPNAAVQVFFTRNS